MKRVFEKNTFDTNYPDTKNKNMQPGWNLPLKNVILVLKCWKREHQRKEQNYQIKNTFGHLVRRKTTSSWERWQKTPLNKQRWMKKLGKSTSEERESSKPKSTAEISSMWKITWSVPIESYAGLFLKGRIQKNGPKGKKIDDYAQNKLYLLRKEGERWPTSIKYCVDALI